MELKREDYRAIKQMDKKQLTAYMARVFKRGYDAGVKAAAKTAAPPALPADKSEE